MGVCRPVSNGAPPRNGRFPVGFLWFPSSSTSASAGPLLRQGLDGHIPLQAQGPGLWFHLELLPKLLIGDADVNSVA